MSANSWTYDFIGEMHSTKTAEFDQKDGSGALLDPLWIGPANYATATNEDQTSVAQETASKFAADLPGHIADQLTQAGYGVISVTVVSVTTRWVRESNGIWWTIPLVAHDLANCALYLTWTARVTLSTPLGHSPIDPATLAFLYKIIVLAAEFVLAALIAYWVIQALKDIAISMVTDTTTVIEYNPDGTIKSITKNQKPDYLGIVVTAGVAIGGILAVVYVLNKIRK